MQSSPRKARLSQNRYLEDQLKESGSENDEDGDEEESYDDEEDGEEQDYR
jgi:hypothetical protein